MIRDPETLQILLDSIHQFVGEVLIPRENEVAETDAIPQDIVQQMREMGLFGLTIPEEFGGLGVTMEEEVNITFELGRTSPAFRSYIGTNNGIGSIGILIDGTPEQKAHYLPKLASGELRLQSMGVTEPTTGTDTTKIKTTAVRRGDKYVINGQKVWISRIQHSDLMILLARTTPLAEVKKKSEGMSIFLVDLREAIGNGLTVQPIANMVNHETNELFFDNLEIPAGNLIGEEGKGFKYILDGLNAERTLIAAECIGDGRWFTEKSAQYARDRVVFGRPIGQNQGVQFPIAEAHIEIEAADLMRWRACQEYDSGRNAGAAANMAKYLAAKASWEAANACLQTHGGFGFANEYDVERKFRETRLYQVAPISTNLILSYVAEHLLELPRSF